MGESNIFVIPIPRYTDSVLLSAGQCSVEGRTDTAYNELRYTLHT